MLAFARILNTLRDWSFIFIREMGQKYIWKNSQVIVVGFYAKFHPVIARSVKNAMYPPCGGGIDKKIIIGGWCV